MIYKLIQRIRLRMNKTVDVSELESCPACRGQAVYHELQLKKRFLFFFTIKRFYPERVRCMSCRLMMECHGLIKDYCFLLWNRRVAMPESEAARLNAVIVERDNLKSLLAQYQAQNEDLRKDYERVLAASNAGRSCSNTLP